MPKKSIVVETPLASIPVQYQTRPVDTTVQPVKPTGKGLATELMEGLKGLSPAIQSYLTLQEANVKANKELGSMDRLLGRTPTAPNSYRNLGWGYSQGYSTLDGEIRGIKISQEYAQALEASNYFINEPNPEVAQKKRQELFDSISQKYLQGTTNIDVIAGASQHILKASADTEEEAFKRFHQQKMTTMLTNVRDNLKTTMVELRTAMIKEHLKPQDQRNLRPVRDMLTSLKQTIEAENLAPEDAAKLVIDAYGEAVIGAAKDDSGLASTMLDVLDAADSHGFVYSRYTKKMPNGEIRYPLRDQIEQLKTDVSQIITHERTINQQDIKLRWRRDEAKILDIINSNGKFEDWYAIAQSAVQYGADVNWAFLRTAWEDSLQGGDPTVRDDTDLVDELDQGLLSGRYPSIRQLRQYHKDGRLSLKTMADIRKRLPEMMKLKEEQRSNQRWEWTLTEQQKEALENDRKFARSAYQTELISSGQAVADPESAKERDMALDMFDQVYRDERTKGATDREATSAASRKANAWLQNRNLLKKPGIKTPDETTQNFRKAIDEVKKLNLQGPRR